MSKVQQTDYLIIGAGAMGIAFADEIFHRDAKATIVLVDRRNKSGGHWRDAYSYVHLHQPAAFYGVNSAELGKGTTDLSSKPEILTYYDQIMDKLLSSGRVQFFSNSNYIGDHKVVSLADETKVTEFKVNRRLIDATHMMAEIPATHAPKYKVDDGVPLVTPNDLDKNLQGWDKYVIVGAGKTGMDAIVYLIDQGIDATKIQWIVPNDAWLWNRAMIQAGNAINEILRHVQCIIDANNPDEVFLKLEQVGSIFRLDKNVLPTKWRCAIVSTDELQKLQRVKNVVRKGRIAHITNTEIQLAQETIP